MRHHFDGGRSRSHCKAEPGGWFRPAQISSAVKPAPVDYPREWFRQQFSPSVLGATGAVVQALKPKAAKMAKTMKRPFCIVRLCSANAIRRPDHSHEIVRVPQRYFRSAPSSGDCPLFRVLLLREFLLKHEKIKV